MKNGYYWLSCGEIKPEIISVNDNMIQRFGSIRLTNIDFFAGCEFDPIQGLDVHQDNDYPAILQEAK